MSENDALELLDMLRNELEDNELKWVNDEFDERLRDNMPIDRQFQTAVERQLWLLLDTITECLIHPVEFAHKSQDILNAVADGNVTIQRLTEDGEVTIRREWATKKAKAQAAKLRKVINTIRKEFSPDNEQ